MRERKKIVLCELCQNHIADKKNSHIIPKFLGRRLFSEISPRHIISISPSGRTEKKQDTYKENFLLCTKCERRFEVIETLIARQLDKLRNYNNFPEEYLLRCFQKQEFIECLKLKPKLIILFLYSIIWRISVSKGDAFKNFKLDNQTESELRLSLNQVLSASSEQLDRLIDSLQVKDTYTICLIKAKDNNGETRGLQTSMKLSEDLYHIYLNDYFIVFYTSTRAVEIPHKLFSLSNNSRVLIPLANLEQWKGLMDLIKEEIKNKGT
jgi:hypothetical protein